MWNCPPSTILVPVDFGEASSRAVAVAADMAKRLRARLRLLHAESLEAPPYFTHEQMGALERQRQNARQRAREYLAAFGSRHGVEDAEVSLVEGEPVSAILAAAATADLVVMGTHGRRGASRWFLGSVAERVVHESRTPVLVVRADVASSRGDEIFARTLVVSPAPDEPETRRVATGLAHAFGGTSEAPVVTCEADLAVERRATSVIVSKAAATGGLLSQPAEQWLRHCSLPMLFVPLVGAGRQGSGDYQPA